MERGAEVGEEQKAVDFVADLLVGEYVVAVYDDQWYIAIVEGEDPDEEEEGFTLLKYMDRKGDNKFVWGKDDLLKTKDTDIISKVSAPIKVSSRFLGLSKDDFHKIVKIMVNWSIFYLTKSVFTFALFLYPIFFVYLKDNFPYFKTFPSHYILS